MVAGLLVLGMLHGAPPAAAAVPDAAGYSAAAPAAIVAGKAKRPRIVWDPIPYGKRRRAQMAAYAKRHYGRRTARLRQKRQIVLHYTVSSTYPPVRRHFAANTPAPGNFGPPERPGVCTHYVVDTDGTIYQLVSKRYMCRHAIGLNDQSIGIEFVERWSARNVLARRAQMRSGVRLVRWLQRRYRIRTRDVIGHAMVNQSRYFTELRGWRNDHVDWSVAQTRAFRRRL